MTTITLPPLPPIYENHAGKWINVDDVRARDLEVARLVLEGAEEVADAYTAALIRNIEVKHHE